MSIGNNAAVRDLKNIGSETIPPYAVVVATGVEDGFFTVQKKTATTPPLAVFVNGPLRIKPQATQAVVNVYPLPALAEAKTGTLTAGDIVGAVNDNIKLHTDGVGFVVVGKTDDPNIWWVNKTGDAPIVVRATAGETAGKFTAKWIDGTGTVGGSEFTLIVLPTVLP